MLSKNLGYLGIFILLLASLFSCMSSTREKYRFSTGNFSKELSLSGQPIAPGHLKMPMGLCVFAERDLLLIIDVQDNMLVKAYRLRDNKFIKSFIIKGAGPNEQLDCHKIQYSGDLKFVYAIDQVKQKIFSYSTEDILAPGKTVFPVGDVVLSDHQLYNAAILPNGNIVDYSNPREGKKQKVFSFYNREGNLLFNIGDFPKTGTTYRPKELTDAFLGWFTASRDGRHIVLCYLNTDFLDLYDANGMLIKRAQGPEYFDPGVKTVTHFKGTMVVPNAKAYHAYSSARVNNGKVYALYEGKDVLEEGGYHKKLLFSFDENLRPQTLFHLSQPIFAFDIDWGSNTLYGLTHHQDNNYLIKIKLP